MADITMCIDKKCPSSGICYRFMAKPDPVRQSYGFSPREPNRRSCNSYIRIREAVE